YFLLPMKLTRKEQTMGAQFELLESRQYCTVIDDGLPPFNPGGLDTPPLPATEVQISLGSFGSSRVRKVVDSVGPSDKVDLFKIKITDRSKLTIDLTNIKQDVDLVLYDAHGNAVAASGNFGVVNERISQSIGKGTYYAAVYYYDGKTNYSLRVGTTP